MNKKEIIEKAKSKAFRRNASNRWDEIQGLEDRSYNTVSNGRVTSYAGQITVWHQGLPYLCEGYGPRGDAFSLDRDGGIKVSLHPEYVKAV
tara:strand:- start:91 stop:363 length:273 start_codon:yes stop_codon:yes gene_type:complete